MIVISIHALREEGDRSLRPIQRPTSSFLSTPSARRATLVAHLGQLQRRYFYPRPPRGGRPLCPVTSAPMVLFLSTPSARRATCSCCYPPTLLAISIHALREEGDAVTSYSLNEYAISIHALREEGDLPGTMLRRPAGRFLSTPSARRATASILGAKRRIPHFYPRPPRGGRRVHRLHPRGTQQFLSTPSARRATLRATSSPCFITYFYPRPPRGGRHVAVLDAVVHLVISIHALREEGDVALALDGREILHISIHALREEGDSKNRDKISIFKQIIQHSARI